MASRKRLTEITNSFKVLNEQQQQMEVDTQENISDDNELDAVILLRRLTEQPEATRGGYQRDKLPLLDILSDYIPQLKPDVSESEDTSA